MKVTPLKPIDVVVLVALLEWEGKDEVSTQRELASSLELPPATLTRALKRLLDAKLIRRRYGELTGIRTNAAEFFVYGVKYVFPTKLGAPTRGIPTAHSAPPLVEHLEAEETYVWPLRYGPIRGTSVIPLHECVPHLSYTYSALHEWFGLLDALRIGGVREQDLAEGFLLEKLRVE
jgi:DNA-binding Lrp family transcriptional regulator